MTSFPVGVFKNNCRIINKNQPEAFPKTIKSNVFQYFYGLFLESAYLLFLYVPALSFKAYCFLKIRGQFFFGGQHMKRSASFVKNTKSKKLCGQMHYDFFVQSSKKNYRCFLLSKASRQIFVLNVLFFYVLLTVSSDELQEEIRQKPFVEPTKKPTEVFGPFVTQRTSHNSGSWVRAKKKEGTNLVDKLMRS